MLDENSQLIQMIQEYQNKGKAQECVQYVIINDNVQYFSDILYIFNSSRN